MQGDSLDTMAVSSGGTIAATPPAFLSPAPQSAIQKAYLSGLNLFLTLVTVILIIRRSRRHGMLHY
jgi:hypothetical protein